MEERIALASQQMAEAGQEGDSLLLGGNVSTPKMAGLEDTTDIDVEGMDTLLEDLRTSPQHSSDDDSLGSDSDDEMSAIGTPSSSQLTEMTSQMSHASLPTSQVSPSSSSSSSSSSSDESEMEDD